MLDPLIYRTLLIWDDATEWGYPCHVPGVKSCFELRFCGMLCFNGDAPGLHLALQKLPKPFLGPTNQLEKEGTLGKVLEFPVEKSLDNVFQKTSTRKNKKRDNFSLAEGVPKSWRQFLRGMLGGFDYLATR